MRKKILVPCGSGVATSTMAAEKLRTLLRQRGIEADIEAVTFRSLESLASQADLIVSVAPHSDEKYKTPVINGIPLLTGVGLDGCIQQIVAALK